MATAFTSLLGLALPVTGELSGAWGDTVNTAITSLLDSAVSGTTTLSVDADVTLTTSDGIANEARQAILLWTATGSVTRNITAPARSKAYFVVNKTGGTQSIVIRGAGPTTGVTVRAGQQSLVVFDGTDFVEVASGDVDGPSSATDNAVARFDGTTGKLVQNSVVTIADTTGNMAGVGTLGVGAITTSGALTYGGVTLSNAVTGTGNMVLSTSPTLVTPALGTPASGVLTNATGLPISTGVSGLGTGVATALAVNVGTAGAPVVNGGALGTPASGTLTNATGLPISTGVSGLGTGVATSLAVNVGTAGAPVVNGGVLGTPSSGTLTNATGLPISTGVSGLGTGVATFLGTPTSANLRTAVTDETGTGALVFANSPTLVTPALGTPASGEVTNLTGTASININGTVGATTASTGAFTTLAASGAVTLDAATANGVAFANASKVLTTGSALTFDGTTFTSVGAANFCTSSGSVGIGINLPTGKLHVLGAGSTDNAATNPTLFVQAAGNTLNAIRFNGAAATDLYFGRPASVDALAWGTVLGGEQMRLTSTGLGIGTSSPASKLDVSGGVRIGTDLTFDRPGVGSTINSTDLLTINAASGKALTFNAGAMRIDAAGNVGIGTSSPAQRLHVAGEQLIQPTTVANAKLSMRHGSIGNNNFFEVDVNLNTIFGTNNAERMRIDSAGNVGIGTSSPATALSFPIGTNKFVGQTAATIHQAGNVSSIGFGVSDGGNQTGVFVHNTHNGSFSSQDIRFLTAEGGISAATERMRITSAGNVGIGTGSPAHVLDIRGTSTALLNVQGTQTDGAAETVFRLVQPATAIGANNEIRSGVTSGQNPYLAFAVRESNTPFATVERMRITTAGNVGIGTSSPAAGHRLHVTGDVRIANSGSETGAIQISQESSQGLIQTRFQQPLVFGTNATERMRITNVGNVGIGTSSPDARLDVNGSVKSSGEMFSDGTDITINNGDTVTIKTLSSGFNNTEIYMLTATNRGGNNAWRLSAIIFGGDISSSGSFRVTTLESSNLVATFSSTALQITNNGASATIRWRLLRLM